MKNEGMFDRNFWIQLIVMVIGISVISGLAVYADVMIFCG